MRFVDRFIKDGYSIYSIDGALNEMVFDKELEIAISGDPSGEKETRITYRTGTVEI